jgi:ketosteroid isomerase-like protein
MQQGSGTDGAVLEANEAFYRAFNHKDMPAMEQVWASSSRVTCVHPGWNVLEGRDDVLESWRRILANPEQPRVVTGGAGVTLSGNTAVVICRELVSGSPLAATNIFVREDGAWKLIHHHSGPVYVTG